MTTTIEDYRAFIASRASDNKMKGFVPRPMPLPYIERCLNLYSCPADIVFDPFSGIGSTGYQALKMKRRFIGTELKPEYAFQAHKFMNEAEATAYNLFGGAAA